MSSAKSDLTPFILYRERPTVTDNLRETYAAFLASRLKQSAAGYRAIAETLEALASEVPLIGTAGNVTASSLAQRAVHSAMWGAANASPDAVINAAAEYDRCVTRAEG